MHVKLSTRLDEGNRIRLPDWINLGILIRCVLL